MRMMMLIVTGSGGGGGGGNAQVFKYLVVVTRRGQSSLPVPKSRSGG